MEKECASFGIRKIYKAPRQIFASVGGWLLNNIESIREVNISDLICSEFSHDYICQGLAEYLSCIVVDKAEAVSVVWSAEIIPDTIRNGIFLQEGNHVTHPCFSPSWRVLWCRIHRTIKFCRGVFGKSQRQARVFYT